MTKARREASKVMENWMMIERMDIIAEDEDQLENEDEDNEAEGVEEKEKAAPDPEPGLEPRELEHRGNNTGGKESPPPPTEDNRGKVKKLTDFFNTIGGSRTQRPPRTPSKTTKTPTRNIVNSGGVKNLRRRTKVKIEILQRKKIPPKSTRLIDLRER